MYQFLNYLHAWTALIAVVALIALVVRSLIGWLSKAEYQKFDNILHASAVGFLHLQLILGLLLYFFYSPITQLAFEDFGAAMKTDTLRFYAVEHITGMILAIVVAQIGRSVAKKKALPTVKFRTAFIFSAIALVLIFGVIPWVRMGTPVFKF